MPVPLVCDAQAPGSGDPGADRDLLGGDIGTGRFVAEIVEVDGRIVDDMGRLATEIKFKRGAQGIWAEPQYVRHHSRQCINVWTNVWSQLVGSHRGIKFTIMSTII